MKTPAILAILPVLCILARAEQSQPLTAAVLDFQTSGKDFESKGAEVATLLNARLSTAPNLLLVERQELSKILAEQELGLAGTVTPESAAKVGNLVGAKVLVTGRLFGADDKFFLVAKIIGTETSRVFGETVTFGDPGAFEKAVAELETKIAEVLAKHAEVLAAKVEEPAARIARLKKIVAGRKLPSVSVRIEEQHLRRPVIDPAAQTEMKLVLQQIGFAVLDTKDSNQQAEVSITGEAFSEFAARKGGLVACRGRIELKMVRTDGGKLLLVDRQTDAGIDLAENTAGKRALEIAALKLLDRIVPKLVE